MIATMTMQSPRAAQTLDRRFSTSANSAGAPLPLLPRRTSSSRPALTSSPSMPLPIRASVSTSSLASYASSSSSTVSTIVMPTNDSDSSTASSPSDGTRPTIRKRRVRGVRTIGTTSPPPVSAPAPMLTIVSATSSQHVFPTKTGDAFPCAPARPMLYTPGMSLRSCGIVSRNSPETSYVSATSDMACQFGSKSASALCDTLTESRMVRKKSGQVVKSSLKSSRSLSRSSGLSVLTMAQASKSEPTTPTSKAVHFDSKLEHVKLFLAEQKPLAVSRDGSPTDDTSGTDSDFPHFIFGADGEGEGRRASKKKLVMQVVNMPKRVPPFTENVAIEDLFLGPDGASIHGKVRVRNLAYSKWIAVRFTFDLWQTTSEVVGKYLDSPSPEFDRFAFTVRLNDLLARIETKTLLLAVRYSIEGREMWDNNKGENYLINFTKVKADEPVSAPSSSPLSRRPATLSDEEASTDMMDLRSKLEKVVNSNDRTGPAFSESNASRTSVSSRSVQQPYPASADPDTAFRSSSSFASRYDFSQSFKNSWDPAAQVHAVHNRTQSFPVSRRPNPWPQTSPSDPYALRWTTNKPSGIAASKTLGSPRDVGDRDSFDIAAGAQPLSVNTSSPPLQPQPRHPAGRNHQRGYFDIALPAGPLPTSLRRTPPGTPRSPSDIGVPLPLPSTYNSLSLSGDINDAASEYFDSSELSTPSMATPSSSRESTPSPSPTELFGQELNMSPDTHYRQFLNKFCFFTGPVSVLQDPSDELPRTHSASDIEEFLSGLPRHLQALGIDEQSSPSRSSSMDDLTLNRSGSLTPTISRMALARSTESVAVFSPTPVLL